MVTLNFSPKHSLDTTATIFIQFPTTPSSFNPSSTCTAAANFGTSFSCVYTDGVNRVFQISNPFSSTYTYNAVSPLSLTFTTMTMPNSAFPIKDIQFSTYYSGQWAVDATTVTTDVMVVSPDSFQSQTVDITGTVQTYTTATFTFTFKLKSAVA